MRFALIALTALAACGPRAPLWVSQRSGFDEETRTIVAVESSDERAREEIIELFDQYMALWIKAYEVATYGGMVPREEDRSIEAALRRIAIDLQQNIEIVERWTHPESGALHLLMRLDLSDAPARARACSTLAADARARLETSAEKAFDELAAFASVPTVREP